MSQFDHMTCGEADEAWETTLKRADLYAAPSEPDDRIAIVLRMVSFLPSDVRDVLLDGASVYIALAPYPDEHLAQFSEMFSAKALRELQERRSTLVKRSDGRRCIFVQVPGSFDIKTIRGFLLQVARFAVGFPGYTATAWEISPVLEQSAQDFATVLNDYVKAEVEFYQENRE